jgi:DNA polymerase sliding clamp subunit (PCNA homolog)
MKFIISSTDLLQSLLQISRVIGSKSPIPVLDNFLFQLNGSELTLTASDSETTLKTIINVAEVETDGEITIPAKLLLDSLKELPTQPIEFNTIDDKNVVSISWTAELHRFHFYRQTTIRNCLNCRILMS